MPAFGTGVDASLGRIDYTPYLQGSLQGSAAIGRGISSAGDSLASALKQYGQNKQIADVTNAENEALLKTRPDLIENAPESVQKLLKKQVDQGTLGVKDSAVLRAFLNTSVTVQEQERKRMEDIQANEIASIAIKNPNALDSLDKSRYSNGALVRGMSMAAQYNQSQADIAKTRSEAEANNYKAQQARNGVTAKFFADPKAAIDYGKQNLGLEDGEVEAVLDTSAGGGYYPRANQNVIEKNKNLASFIDASSKPPEFRNLTPTQQQVKVPLPAGGFVWQDVGSESEKRVAGFAQKQKEFLAAQNDQDRSAIAGQAAILLGNGMFPEQLISQWNKLRKVISPPSGGKGGPNVTSIVQTPTPNPAAPIVTSVAAAPKGAPSPAPAPIGNYGGLPTFSSDAGNKPLRAQTQVVAPPAGIAASVTPVPDEVATPPGVSNTNSAINDSIPRKQTFTEDKKFDKENVLDTITGGLSVAYAAKKAVQSPALIKGLKSLSSSASSLFKVGRGVAGKIAAPVAIADAIDIVGGKLASINLPQSEKKRISQFIGEGLAKLTADSTETNKQKMKGEILDRLERQMKSNLTKEEKSTIRILALESLSKIEEIKKPPQNFSDTRGMQNGVDFF